MGLRCARTSLLLGFVSGLLAFACGDDDTGEDGVCQQGTHLCECLAGTTCTGDLVCNNGFCVEPGSGDTHDGMTTSDGDESTTSDGDSDTTSDGDTTGDSDGNEGCVPGELMCGGVCVDTLSDPENCGSCGVTCQMTSGLGGCDGGVCAPRWSDCQMVGDPVAPCADVCTTEGASCVEGGCGGSTIKWYGSILDCEDYSDLGGLGITCEESPFAESFVYRCCCQ